MWVFVCSFIAGWQRWATCFATIRWTMGIGWNSVTWYQMRGTLSSRRLYANDVLQAVAWEYNRSVTRQQRLQNKCAKIVLCKCAYMHVANAKYIIPRASILIYPFPIPIKCKKAYHLLLIGKTVNPVSEKNTCIWLSKRTDCALVHSPIFLINIQKNAIKHKKQLTFTAWRPL